MPETRLNRLLAEWDKSDSPGFAVVVVRGGSVIYQRGFGNANLEHNIRVSPSTVFQVASLSKQFTAFSICLLVQQGKLSLDDDIRKYLPYVPDFEKRITIRHLIHHTSGLRDQWELLAMAGWRLDDVITEEQILKMVRNQKELNFEPGEEYLYSNTGYTLLAEIVANATGQSFREWTDRNIFLPLQMKNTHFIDDHQMIVKKLAHSYVAVKDRGFKKSLLNYASVGATNLYTTVEDLAKWIKNFNFGTVGGESVLKQMQEQGVLNDGEKIEYAFGLISGQFRGLHILEHGGSDAGYRSYLAYFPEKKIGIALLSNSSALSPSRLIGQIADIYLADEVVAQKPEVRKEEQKIIADIDPAVYDKLIGKYLLKSGSVLTIFKENSQLMGQSSGQPKVELLSLLEGLATMKSIKTQITFHLDKKTDKVISLNLYQVGENLPAQKIDINLSPEQLEEFVGDYYSEELGTDYEFIIKNRQLVATHRRHNDMTLTPVDEDKFSGEQWWFRRVHFVRNSEKQITGFRLTGERARNIAFAKSKRDISHQ